MKLKTRFCSKNKHLRISTFDWLLVLRWGERRVRDRRLQKSWGGSGIKSMEETKTEEGFLMVSLGSDVSFPSLPFYQFSGENVWLGGLYLSNDSRWKSIKQPWEPSTPTRSSQSYMTCCNLSLLYQLSRLPQTIWFTKLKLLQDTAEKWRSNDLQFILGPAGGLAFMT